MSTKQNFLWMEYPATVRGVALLHAALIDFTHSISAESPMTAHTHRLIWATMEIAANIVEHAYPHPDANAIFQVDLHRFPHRLEITLRDWGIPFEQDWLTQPSIPDDWHKHQRGGLGLPLARRAVDELSYVREEDVNVWRVVAVTAPQSRRSAPQCAGSAR